MKRPSGIPRRADSDTGRSASSGSSWSAPTTVLLDIDGTLVDSNYQHILAWQKAFGEFEIEIPAWRIHRHMGMGGDQLVESLTNATIERKHGDEIRAAEASLYRGTITEVKPVPGATRTIEWLVEHGFKAVLASSGRTSELAWYLARLAPEPGPTDVVGSDDVKQTKPEPDLIRRALEKTDSRPHDCLLVGDSIWDAQAARRAGVRSIAVRTGGFHEAELLSHGARAVVDSIDELPSFLKSAFALTGKPLPTAPEATSPR